MRNISISNFRKNIAVSVDSVIEGHAPILLTRREGEAAVLMSAEDYRAMKETLYLLSSKANAESLYRSIAEIEAGQAKARKLIEE